MVSSDYHTHSHEGQRRPRQHRPSPVVLSDEHSRSRYILVVCRQDHSCDDVITFFVPVLRVNLRAAACHSCVFSVQGKGFRIYRRIKLMLTRNQLGY